MLLLNLDAGHGKLSRGVLRGFQFLCPGAPYDILKASWYRSDIFGNPFCSFAEGAMRGTPHWSRGEKELLVAFVSSLNHCVF
jgi:hypothetical protein